MTFYQKLERRLGRYAVPNLMKYICVMYAVGFLIQYFDPNFYYFYLDLDPEAILHGHIWRLVTFLFFYPSRSLIWAAIGIYLYYSLGQTLERVWGTFKYNFFFVMGVLLLVVGSIAFYLITGYSLQLYPVYMTFSIFLAYALTFPDATFLIYFIVPIKAKFLAILEIVLYVLNLLNPYTDLGSRMSILLSLLNVAIFFHLTGRRRRGGYDNIYRMH